MLEAVIRHPDVVVGENLEAGARLEVRQLAVVDCVHRRHSDLRDDVIEVPLEVLTLEALPKLLARLQRLVLLRSQLDALELVRADRRVEVLARTVHPRLGNPHQVLRDNGLAVAVELVREVLEDVSDARAHHRDDSAAAHPRPEGQLDVLAAPDLHAGVELADLLEVILVDGDGAADERRREERVAGLHRAGRLVVRHPQPRVSATDKVRRQVSISYIRNYLRTNWLQCFNFF